MDFASFDEFWKALGRLYDTSLRHDEAITRIEASLQGLSASTQAISNNLDRLLTIVEKDHAAIMDHEARLRDFEDQRRRGGQSPQ